MDQSTQSITPLRQRMIDDIRMRKLGENTQSQYIRAVKQLTRYLGRSPETASVEDLRRYQLHLVDRGTSPVSLNAAITGLKFFFDITLDHAELMAKMQPVRVPRTLPVVLSREEVTRLIVAARNLKHQTALSVAYGAGLRASEVVALKVGDIDSERMTLRVEQGKLPVGSICWRPASNHPIADLVGTESDRPFRPRSYPTISRVERPVSDWLSAVQHGNFLRRWMSGPGR